MKALLLELLMGRGPVIPLLALATAAALVLVLASRLARHADTIADATGLGRLWIGSMLLAAATSLPEVLTAVGHLGIETLAIGAVYLGVMGALYRSLRDTSAAASEPDPHGASRGVRRRAFVGFAVAAAGLVVVAPLLVLSAEALAPFR